MTGSNWTTTRNDHEAKNSAGLAQFLAANATDRPRAARAHWPSGAQVCARGSRAETTCECALFARPFVCLESALIAIEFREEGDQSRLGVARALSLSFFGGPETLMVTYDGATAILNDAHQKCSQRTRARPTSWADSKQTKSQD